MHCPNCGQEMLESARFCENCGTPAVRQPVGSICARCGSQNQPEAEFCAECGARLGVEVIPIKAFCPQCGAAVKEGAAFCQECGADLNAVTAPAPFVCPECGEPLDPDAAFCGNCGRVLQQGGEYAPAPATTAAEYQPSYPPESQDYSPQQDWAQLQPQDCEYSQQQAQYPPQGQPQTPIQQQGWTQQQPQKSNRNKMLMAAAAAVVLLVIGITGFWKPGYLLDLFRPTAKLENGVLALNDITLDFKQTNLSNGAATMTTVKDKEEEIHNGLIGDLYVMKIDKSCQGKVAVSVPTPKDFKPTNDEGLYIKLGVGRDYSLADGKTVRRYSYFDTEIKDGKAVAVIDPAALGHNLRRSKAIAKLEEEPPFLGDYVEYVGIFYRQIGKVPFVWAGEGFQLGEGYQYTQGHFRLWYNYDLRRHKNVYMGGDVAQNLLNDLEEAYNYYKTHGYADHVDTYTPIDVYIARLEGEADEGGWDPLSGNMELREDRIFGEKYNERYEGNNRNNVKATIYHEMFHAIQQSILGNEVYASDSKKSNWFDEATATYREKLVINLLSENGKKQYWRLWKGPIPKNTDDRTLSAAEGYGRGPLIEFMSRKLGGDDWIKNCYENWSSDFSKLKDYMRKIAPTEADFAAKFYLELVTDLGIHRPANYYGRSQAKGKDPIEEGYVSALKLEFDKKTKEKIANGEEDALPIVFTSQAFELEGYGGHVVALVVPQKRTNQKTINQVDGYPDKCQLKLETEGACKIQLIRFQLGNLSNVVTSKSNIINNFKEQTSENYLYLVLVTSAQSAKQNVVLKATLEKEEDLKEGIYNGKATVTRGKKIETTNNRVGFRLTQGKDGRWGLSMGKANGDHMGTAYNVPITYDAKQKIWKGHRKFKYNVSKNPDKPQEVINDIHCTMKVNMEGKDPFLIVDYNCGVDRSWGFSSLRDYGSFKVHFEGKWSSELKGKTLPIGKVTILE